MKIQSTLLALCLVGAGFANGQSTTNSSTTTTNTTTGTYTDTTSTKNTNSTGTNMNTNSGTGTNMNTNSGTNTNTGTYSNQSNTGTTTGTMNNSTTPSTNNSTYSSSTTTTTTTSSDGMNTSDAYGTQAMGKSGRFGIYAGFNNSVFVNEPVDQSSRARFGYQLGVYGRSAGTIFGQIGAEFRTSTAELLQRVGPGPSPTEITGKIDQYFLAVPAYVGVRIGESLGLRLQAGAELSALVAQGKNNFQLGMDDVNRIILGGLLGAGINLGPITLDGFYNHGLVNVFEGADTKRRMFGFNVGLRF